MGKLNKKVLIIIIILCGIIWGLFKYFISNKSYEELENINEELAINNQISNTTNEADSSDKEKIVVHITGAVCNEGVYELDENSRIADVIKMAGGLKEDVDLKQINLAYMLEDGMKINIPSKNDKTTDNNIENDETYITKEDVTSSNNTNLNNKISKININTATQEELETLPGIGPSIATKIINYRKENGKFKKIEDIKNVNGIGESKFNKIKEFIKI